MKRLILALLIPLAMGASCPPKPTPTPTPTPTPGVPDKGIPQGPERLLRPTADARVQVNGQPFDMVMAVQCCQSFKPNGVETNSLWPLASEAWQHYTIEKGAANAFHMRMGPFYTDADTEIEWSGYGPPYQPDWSWNPVFWQKVRELAWHAYEHNAYVEVVPIDTWGCKYSQWGNRYAQWPPDAIQACGRTWHPEHERYARKVVDVFALSRGQHLVRARIDGREQVLDWSWAHDVRTRVGERQYVVIEYINPLGGALLARHEVPVSCAFLQPEVPNGP